MSTSPEVGVTDANLEYFNLDAMEVRDDLAAVGTYDWARSVGKAVIEVPRISAPLLSSYAFTSI